MKPYEEAAIAKVSDDSKDHPTESNYKGKKRYRIKEGFIMREIAGEYIIVPNDPDCDITNGVLAPNGSASFLWSTFQQPNSLEDAVQRVIHEYDVAEDTVRDSVHRFVDELLRYRILEEVG